MQQITGRLTADATVKTLEGGKQVVNFSIADNETYKPKGQDEPVQVTTFFNCSYWINTAVAAVLRKGAVVQLSGRMSARGYQTNTGGIDAALNFRTNRIEVLAYADKGAGNKGSAKSTAPKTGKKDNKDEGKDDLPF